MFAFTLSSWVGAWYAQTRVILYIECQNGRCISQNSQLFGPNATIEAGLWEYCNDQLPTKKDREVCF